MPPSAERRVAPLEAMAGLGGARDGPAVRNHSVDPLRACGESPPVTKAAVWPSAEEAQTLAENACYDCHSNLTKRWWATRIAPASWLAQIDENGGRNILNFSEWDMPQAELDEVTEAVQSGSMPPVQYKLFHSNARLSDTERQQLIHGLEQLYATDPPAGTKHGEG